MIQEVSFTKCESHKETFEIADETKDVLKKYLELVRVLLSLESLRMIACG